MPETTLPPMENIGAHGEFEVLTEVIVIERANERLFVSPNGTRLGRCVVQPAASTAVPSIQADRVLEYAIRRIGMKHTDADLLALRSLVQQLGSQTERGLRIVDLFGWSGEIALAMCRADSEDMITIIDDLTGTGRILFEQARSLGEAALTEILEANVGALANFRIFFSKRSPKDVVSSFTSCQEIDLVFVDSAITLRELPAMMDMWIQHLGLTGVLVGANAQADGVEQVLEDAFVERGVPVTHIENSSLWMVTKHDYLNAMKHEEAASV